MPSGFGETVTVHRSAAAARPGRATDSFGDRLPETTHVVAGCAVAPTSSTETGERGETVTTGVTLYGPYDVDIRSTDRIELADGRVFVVLGDPQRWRDPFTGQTVGSTVNLQAVRG
jgi:hypothetical protein